MTRRFPEDTIPADQSAAGGAAMKSRPILMSAPMVRGLLDVRKTQTRRAVKLPTKTETGPIYERPDMGGWEATTHGGGGCFTIGRDGSRRAVPEEAAIWHRTCGVCIGCPYGVPGDLLWVREGLSRRTASFFGIEATNGVEEAFYKADGEDVVNEHDFNICPWWSGKSLPSIHMPRWASRLTLEITDVRVERLQDISYEDCRDEGTVCTIHGDKRHVACSGLRDGYRLLWESLNGPGSWGANPWCWAISFRTHPINIDEYLTRQGGN